MTDNNKPINILMNVILKDRLMFLTLMQTICKTFIKSNKVSEEDNYVYFEALCEFNADIMLMKINEGKDGITQ